MRESHGEKCYRLFGDVINEYKHRFENAERIWKKNVRSLSFVTDTDHCFIVQLDPELRQTFWNDKISYFRSAPRQRLNYNSDYWVKRSIELEKKDEDQWNEDDRDFMKENCYSWHQEDPTIHYEWELEIVDLIKKKITSRQERILMIALMIPRVFIDFDNYLA